MADLYSLVKLHQHELDEKTRELKKFYDKLEKTEQNKQKIQDMLENEKKLLQENTQDVHFSFANFQEKAKSDILKINKSIDVIEKQIFVIRDEMLDIYAEMKKYDMVQQEREKIEAEAQRLKETKTLDEIANISFIRKNLN